jgi:hypothetical protein
MPAVGHIISLLGRELSDNSRGHCTQHMSVKAIIISSLYTHIFPYTDVFVHITHSCTPSRPFWEVKLGRVESVVRCVSTCEASMTNAFVF